MNRLGRVVFVLLCIVALALLVLAALVFAGFGVKDKPSSSPSARKGAGGETIAYAPTTTAPPKTPAPPQVSPVVLVVTASRGD